MSQFIVHSDPFCNADKVIKHSLLVIATLFFILLCTSHFVLKLGYTPLHDAAENGSTDVLNALLTAPGCDINLKVMCAYLVLVSLLLFKIMCFDQFHVHVLYQYT